MCKRVWLVILLGAAVSVLPCQAQVARSATGPSAHFWAGAEYSNYSSDQGSARLPGVTVFADFRLYQRFGLEGEARFLDFTQPGGLTEKSLLTGPFMTIYQRRRWSGNVKVEAGGGFVHYTPNPNTYGTAEGSYFEFAPGGDLEYRLARRLKLRGGYEYQFMPSAPNLPLTPNHGLTPNGFSFGASYRVF